MKPIAESYSIVVAGQWNPNVFKPDWVKQHLADDGNSSVEVAFPIGDPSLPPRIKLDDVLIFPSQSRLDIKAEKPTKGSLRSTVAAATKCLDLLTHTPISALGINMGFESLAEDAESIIKLFSFDDDARIDRNSYKFQGAEIKRKYRLNDCVLNLQIAYNSTHIKIDFNYHFDCKNAAEALEHIQKCPVDNLYDRTEKFLKETYDLEIEESEDE